ncbi:MAG: lactate utilization protein [Planctomycetota bacterium]|nr:lactate utilization protein [Planctomycetota bacterium]
MSARDEILDSLGAAASLPARSTGGASPHTSQVLRAVAGASLSGFSRAVSADYNDEQVDRFCERVRAVKGEAERAADSFAARDLVKALLTRWGIRGVVYNADPLVMAVGLPALLDELKIAALKLDGGPAEAAWREELGAAAREKREPTVPWDLAVIGCEGAIAESGTVIHRAGKGHGRGGWLLSQSQLVLVDANQLVPDLEALFVSGGALDRDDLPRAITAVTGPSRTADIEQTLTVGVHGPGRFCAVVVG